MALFFEFPKAIISIIFPIYRNLLFCNEVVDTQVSITINAYGSETNDSFVIRGSETPKAIPAWVWALLVIFVGFALFYAIMYWNPELYKSFF